MLQYCAYHGWICDNNIWNTILLRLVLLWPAYHSATRTVRCCVLRTTRICPSCKWYHFQHKLILSKLVLHVKWFITFCVSRRQCKMYCGHACLCVCLSVCVSVRGRTPTLLLGPGCNLGHGRDCPLVVHYWADLQSGHGLRCYGNITWTLVTSLHPSRDMTT